jgi:hypothetical protein
MPRKTKFNCNLLLYTILVVVLLLVLYIYYLSKTSERFYQVPDDLINNILNINSKTDFINFINKLDNSILQILIETINSSDGTSIDSKEGLISYIENMKDEDFNTNISELKSSFE